jgi:demethylmenaquinone methyltransferase/2-methoxy-6-polyprenyl-1,4-benzoquinol methylase
MPELLPLNFESPEQPDAAYIRTMFDRMARRYDLFTALTGFGQAARWRAGALAAIRPGMRVLDLGCGTGDLSLEALGRVGPSGEVVGLDFSEEMLRVLSEKHRRRPIPGGGTLTLVRGCAEDLPVDARPVDAVVSGFVLRNLYAQIDRVLDGVRRSLRPGGHVAFLDLTEPAHPLLQRLFRGYLLGLAGLYGALLFGRHYPIPYLPDSARRFFKAREFTAALARAGFTGISAQGFCFGTVTLYRAVTPSELAVTPLRR